MGEGAPSRRAHEPDHADSPGVPHGTGGRVTTGTPCGPGVPLRAKEGGVLRRPGHTEAAVDLARLAGLQPAGVLCEIVSQKDEGDMARREELEVFAADHDLQMITIADLIAYRRRTEKQ